MVDSGLISSGAQCDMKFKMKYSGRVIGVTIFWIVAVVAFLAYMYYFSGGSFLPAWLTVLTVSVMLFVLLSIPTFVSLTPFAIEIHCMVDLTQIKYFEIKRFAALEKRQMSWCLPLFCMPGVFGYYGYFIDLKSFRIIQVYARSWNNFVMIEDKASRRYIISVEDRDAFVAQLNKTISHE